MSDWNIADYPLFNGIKNTPDLAGKFVFPAFGPSGFAVQTSADRLGGITTDNALRCVAAVMNLPSAQMYDRYGNFVRACDALDSAILGGVYSVPPAGRREVIAPVSNYADPRRYVTDIWPEPWDNWKWTLQGPGEMLNNSPRGHERFSLAEFYTAISWALTGKGDGSYDPAFDGWADGRGGRKASEQWTSLPIGNGYTDAYYMAVGDGIKVVISQAGLNQGSRVQRIYWFTKTRQSHSLRAILAFVAAFAAVAAVGYAASGNTAAAGAGGGGTAAGETAGGTGATAGGTGATAGGTTVTTATTGPAGGMTLGDVAAGLKTGAAVITGAASVVTSAGQLVQAANGPGQTQPANTAPASQTPSQNSRATGIITALAATGAALLYFH